MTDTPTPNSPLTAEEEAQMRQLVADYQQACASNGKLFPEEKEKALENIEWAEGEIGERVGRLFATLDAERAQREQVERARHWIPVTESLPEKLVGGNCSHSVLAWWHGVELASYWPGTNRWLTVDMEPVDPTHWMPLPKGPEESGSVSVASDAETQLTELKAALRHVSLYSVADSTTIKEALDKMANCGYPGTAWVPMLQAARLLLSVLEEKEGT